MATATRRNGPRLQELLHEDFVEIGRSGCRWTRDEIVSSLAEEAEYESPVVSEWQFVRMSPELVLVTYRATVANLESRHASIWDIGAEPAQMRFHQGNTIPGGKPVR